ncbi:hypothetical protein MGG_08833 [Pyricularia oryzae 70-15]|uniref:Uncharacterized protein n=3 Tax=Pyricularia oryzae TaxID=318829 RepID=G4MV30_PYRO7|nr:uncharacterized protein MGG_08833 [Pyricularia oryzae 70-15]EHA54045.1 hypothetical protein MGG_08833 [Pyricularia oryzae 70-15]ELQ42157.1 hypothetical protein OOU_Y34scaffold00228g48 [Pyricularia oryzae Y34]KAI7930843.1 hypothetical protein M9X92_000523 [Pyricularia oryzae]KAI7932326.1 hypothetical protein M0657_000456 [Pyricularia oryzae]
MAYLFYSTILFVMVLGTGLYLSRARWTSQLRDINLPGSNYFYSRLQLGSSFSDDAEAGLSSANFDLTGNIDEGDARAGLDDAAKAEILRIMKQRRLRFDEARKVYMENRFRDNGIGPDGRPRDPKFVSFS